ncbi:FMN-dependent oxidoreductase (nitrilotriacetate monooxygenase family) [Bradyrhizobium barranii subsp. barranii]
MAKQIRLNAFAMNCVAHQSPGLWTHPRDRTAEYNRLPYWIDLARTLERGRFDGLFLADVLGVYDVYGNSPDAALRNAAQTPSNEPLLLLSAMAAVTKNLGFGVTSNLSFEPPYPFARRMSTLDHLTEGRIGWNVVTGYLDSAARGAGKDKQTGHDDRYDIADEYMEVVYKLWEGSWEDDAVLRDRARGIFTDPSKVHRINHESANYRINNTIHLSEPSPQRTPVLYQAGTSPRGRQFAAKHAECVFMSGPSAKIIAPRVSAIRQEAAALGRNPAEILMFNMMTIILGNTEAEAAAKYADYRSHISPEGALALMSGWTGIDFSGYELDQQVRHVQNDAGRSALDNVTRGDPDRVWTVRDVIEHVGIGGAGPVVVGTPESVADKIEDWFEKTDVDGLNVAFAISPGDFEDIADMLVPELTKRGRYKPEYAKGTLREEAVRRRPRKARCAASGGGVSGGEAGIGRHTFGVVPANAGTHYPREQFGEGWSFGITTIRNR